MAAYLRASFFWLASLALLIGTSVGTRQVDAALPPFSTIRSLTGPYLFGPSTLVEFDQFVAARPNYANQIKITFYPNGSCLIEDITTSDSMTGSYSRLNNNRIDVNIVLPPGSYFTNAKYKLTRQNGTNWYGEMYFNNVRHGFLRGSLN